MRNREPQLGISHSIRMGIEAIEEAAMYKAQDAILFAVCDQPELTDEVFYGLIHCYGASGKKIVCAADGERLGNPVIFESSYWEELKRLHEEQGGKTVLKRHPEDVELYQVKDGKKLRDIDVPADLKPLVIHAPASGVFQPRKRIGDVVKTEEVIGVILSEEEPQREVPIPVSMTGLLRGMIKEGYLVKKGLKIMDIEPRKKEKELCFLISDKAKCIGESVYQVIRDYENAKTGR